MEPHWLQDYPVELARASAAQLKAWFSIPKRLIGNLLFQTVRYRQLGLPTPGYGKEHRGYWYHPLCATLARAGFMSQRELERWRDPVYRSTAGGKLYALFQDILGELIKNEVFTFRELGFADPGNGTVGDRRPNVLLVVEKQSLQESAERLVQEFGVSMIVTGGSPDLLDMEYFAPRLRPHAPITMVSLVDFDPGGWIVAESTVDQLRRCGVEFVEGIHHLVRPECFTPEELSLYALPCSTLGGAATIAREWVKRSGGVNGEALGIHSDHLQPVERVLARMAAILEAL